jgi:hypothetical protein
MMAFCFRIYGGVEHITDSILGREKNLSSELEFKLDFCDSNQYE